MLAKYTTYLFSIPYFILAIVVISVQLLELQDFENIFKPFLLIILMLWYAIDQDTNGVKINLMFLLALFFSLLGDVFLMPYFDNFILGLIFFLLSHVAYVLVFLKGNYKTFMPTLLRGRFFLIQILSTYAALLIFLMMAISKQDSMVLMIAIPVYATVILFMVLSTYVYSKVHFYNFGRFVLLGGIFFFISDSVIAINKFIMDIDYSSIWIMGIYALAQWLLVFGYMNSKKKA